MKKAIDYAGLLGVAGEGAVQPAGIIPSLIAGTLPASEALKQDLAGAKAALAASGMAGQKPKLAYPSDLTLNGLSFQTLAEKLQSQLAAAGIAIDLAPAPVATELDNYRNGKEQMGLWYWGPDFPDPSNYLAFAPGGLIGKRASWPATAAPAINAVATAGGRDRRHGPAGRPVPAVPAESQRLRARSSRCVQPPSNVVTATSVTGAAYNPIWTVDVGTIGAK